MGQVVLLMQTAHFVYEDESRLPLSPLSDGLKRLPRKAQVILKQQVVIQTLSRTHFSWALRRAYVLLGIVYMPNFFAFLSQIIFLR